MDPLTQGTLGAALPQTVAAKRHAAMAMVCGIAGGMAPDLDVLIRSTDDPLLFLEYHRQFTHSLVFIPLGALLVTGVLWGLVGRRLHWTFRRSYMFVFLGYATHALLDACTTYGTLLFWPFSDERFAWNTISIIDPLFTLPLLASVVAARLMRRRLPAILGLTWALLYLGGGLVARDAAQAAGAELARSRGHDPVHVDAKPSFANIVLWKTVYRHEGRYYVDALRLGATPKIYPGTSVAALDVARDLPWLDPTSLQATDIERFRWFSRGFIALDPQHPDRVMDLRYSLLPNQIRPLWSIQLDRAEQNTRHVAYLTHRGDAPGDSFKQLLKMLRGQDLP